MQLSILSSKYHQRIIRKKQRTIDSSSCKLGSGSSFGKVHLHCTRIYVLVQTIFDNRENVTGGGAVEVGADKGAIGAVSPLTGHPVQVVVSEVCINKYT